MTAAAWFAQQSFAGRLPEQPKPKPAANLEPVEQWEGGKWVTRWVPQPGAQLTLALPPQLPSLPVYECAEWEAPLACEGCGAATRRVYSHPDLGMELCGGCVGVAGELVRRGSEKL